MTFILNQEYYDRISEGLIPGNKIVHKFGASLLNGTISPITNASIFRTPTLPVALEFISDDINDTSAGSGAQEITIEAIDLNWDEIIIPIETNGTTAVPLPSDVLRVNRWFVSRSGTYATQTSGSHQGKLTLQELGAGAIWDTIGISPFPIGQSQIGVYSSPRNKKVLLLSKNVFVDTNKTADIYFFARRMADDISTPFSGTMRLFEKEVGISGGFSLATVAPKLISSTGAVDIGFMGLMSPGTAESSVEFELHLIDI